MAYLIVLRHVGQTTIAKDNDIFQFIFDQWISPIGVPVFFLISGYLFFNKEFTITRLQRQIKRIFRLYIIWSLIYLPFVIVIWTRDNVSLCQLMKKYVQEFLFGGGYYHLWYLPSTIVALVLVSVFNKYLDDRICIVISVILYFLGYMADTWSYCLSPTLTNILTQYTDIFLTTRNGIFFGTLCVLSGKLLAQHQTVISNKRLILLLCVGVMVQFIEAFIIRRVIGVFAVNIMISPVVNAALLFLLFKNFKFDESFNKYNFRDLSSIIYFGHPFVINIYLKLSHILQISIDIKIFALLIIMSITLFGLIFIKLKKRIPQLKILI